MDSVSRSYDTDTSAPSAFWSMAFCKISRTASSTPQPLTYLGDRLNSMVFMALLALD